MKTLSNELSSLTGFPKLPHWALRAFLNYPNLVPIRYRWKIASKGLGLLVSEIIKSSEADSSGSKDLVTACRNLGIKQGEKVKKEFAVDENDFTQSLKVVVLANRLFGINSKIVKKENNVAQTRITKCSWAGGSYWGAKPCSALSAWEIGLMQGLNPNIKVKFLKRMSQGDDCCEAEYRLSKED